MTKEDEQDAISAFLQRADTPVNDPLDPALPTHAPQGGESGTPVGDDDVLSEFMVDEGSETERAVDAAPDRDDWHPGAELDDLQGSDREFDQHAVDEPVLLGRASDWGEAPEELLTEQHSGGPKTGAAALLGWLFAGISKRAERVRQEPAIPAMRIPIAGEPEQTPSDDEAAAEPTPARKKISMREGAIMLVVGLIVVAWLFGKGVPDTPIAAIDPPTLDSIEIDPAPVQATSEGDIELPSIDGAPDRRLMSVSVTQPLDFTEGEPDALTDQMVLPELKAEAAAAESSVGAAVDVTNVAIDMPVTEPPPTEGDVSTPAMPSPPLPAGSAAGDVVSATFVPEGGGAAVALPTTSGDDALSAPAPVAAAPTAVPAPVSRPAVAPVARPVVRKPEVKVLAVMVPGNCANCTPAAVLMSKGAETVVASGDRWNGYEVTIAGDRVSLSGRGGRWSFLPES